jgi:hypothetical protein
MLCSDIQHTSVNRSNIRQNLRIIRQDFEDDRHLGSRTSALKLKGIDERESCSTMNNFYLPYA